MNNLNASVVIKILKECYPDAHCELNHRSPFELLIAVILSAQCTDKRVNQITEELFKICKTPSEFLRLGQESLEEIIKPCGLYKNKAKNIILTCKKLIDKYDGSVPDTMDALIELPGVGRKTASVVLSNAFGVPAMPVDTHVFRVSNRIGFSNAKNVDETESQLKKLLPIEDWIIAHHLLIFHGRQVCHARQPDCKNCKIKGYCDFTK